MPGESLHITMAAPHETFHRSNGVVRVLAGGSGCGIADMHIATTEVAHHRGQQVLTLMIAHDGGHRRQYGGHQRVGGPQVDADSQPPLMRFGGHARFRNLH